MNVEQHVLDWLPAYALGSLDSEEKAQVERHLRSCPLCQRELQAYQGVVEQLPLATPLREPPAHLRQAILTQAAQTRQAGKQTAGKPVSTAQASFTDRLRRALTSPIPAWGLAVVAVLVLALLAMNVVLFQRLAAAPGNDFSVVSLAGTNAAPQASAWMVLSADGRAGTLITQWLPPLPKGKEYQLWLIKDGQRTDGGTFWVDDRGYASLWVNTKEPLSDFKQFGVTIEPEGGSPAPTGNKVLDGGS